jgi:hypothetical protein
MDPIQAILVGHKYVNYLERLRINSRGMMWYRFCSHSSGNEGGDPMFEEVINHMSMAIALVAMGIAFYLYYLPF